MSRSDGRATWGRHKVPLPVSFKGMEFSDMLKVEILEPNPRFIHTYVNG